MPPEREWSESQRQVLRSLEQAIVECDSDRARSLAQEVLREGVEPVEAIRVTFASGAERVHEKFETGEYYLPHLVLAGDAMTAAGEVLEQAVPKERLKARKVVVIGTVEADLHSVGKNIVAMMLRSGGFEVHDLGVDVRTRAFIDKAREVNADLIAASSLLTTTMPYQRELIEDLRASGLRDRFKVRTRSGGGLSLGRGVFLLRENGCETRWRLDGIATSLPVPRTARGPGRAPLLPGELARPSIAPTAPRTGARAGRPRHRIGRDRSCPSSAARGWPGQPAARGSSPATPGRAPSTARPPCTRGTRCTSSGSGRFKATAEAIDHSLPSLTMQLPKGRSVACCHRPRLHRGNL